MTKGKIQWIDSNPLIPIRVEESDKEPEWADMQKYVDGYLEHVSVLVDGKRAHMYVNEEGLIHGLPSNPRATAHYFRASRERGIDPLPGSPGIVGQAILITDIPLEGYDF